MDATVSILIVEDAPTQAEQLKAILEEQSFLVSIAKDGLEASKMVSTLATQPSLVISDIVMPKMNGYELCETLKSNPKSSHIPIILLTSVSEVRRIIGI